ncbi:MAG: hypothetical protein ACQET8_17460 [Bacillota bacterium]
MIQRLTDIFTKREDSNIGKLILIISTQIDSLNETFLKIESWRDIDQAEGTTLDLEGSNVGQKRGQVSDEIMRVLIKARIARNNSDGTINKMIDALARSLNTTPDKVKIKALYDQGEPAAIMIEDVPIDALNAVGMTAGQFGLIAQQIVGAGIRVASIDLSGTFSFSSAAGVLETDVEFGFAPLDQSTGGSLGSVFDPNQSVNLPI